MLLEILFSIDLFSYPLGLYIYYIYMIIYKECIIKTNQNISMVYTDTYISHQKWPWDSWWCVTSLPLRGTHCTSVTCCHNCSERCAGRHADNSWRPQPIVPQIPMVILHVITKHKKMKWHCSEAGWGISIIYFVNMSTDYIWLRHDNFQCVTYMRSTTLLVYNT